MESLELFIHSLTSDNDIEQLIKAKKNIIDKEKTIEKCKHQQRNIKVVDEHKNKYMVFLRQSLKNQKDFSCGINLIFDNNESLTLLRCNGSNYNHKNRLEDETLGYRCHIHKATMEYINKNKKPDGHAVIANEYDNISGAYRYLLKKCHIKEMGHQLSFLDSSIWN